MSGQQKREIASARRARITKDLIALGNRPFTFESCLAIRGLVITISRANRVNMPEHTRKILEGRHEEQIQRLIEGKPLNEKIRAVEGYILSLELRQKPSTFRSQMPDIDSWGESR